MERTYNAGRSRAAVVLAVLLAACGVPGQTVSVNLPDIPGHYRPYVTHLIVRWWDGEHVQKRIFGIESRELHLPISAAGAAIPVVWVTPLGGPSGTIRFEPYGGWSGRPGETIRLDRYGGAVARIVVTLAAHGIDPALINLDRLRALVRARLPATPRILDSTRLQTALARREMRSYHVSSLRAPAYQVRLPETGREPEPWVTDDMWDHPITPAPAGPYELFSVPVMAGEVRRLWRPAPGRDGYQLLVVYRTPDGNGFHRLMADLAVPAARGAPATPGVSPARGVPAAPGVPPARGAPAMPGVPAARGAPPTPGVSPAPVTSQRN